MIKTYQLINDINLTTPIRIGDRPKMVSFTGGMRNSGEEIRHGCFTTADEKVQAALESDSGYGKTFRCITPEPPDGADETDSEAAGTEDTASALLPGDSVTELTKVPGITNKQAAIEWLAANRGIDGLKPTCKAEAVRNAAALHGVSFPDWK